MSIFPDLSGLNTAQGPRFIYEPPSYQGFSNNTGGSLSCSGHGVPPPRISWVDGSTEQVKYSFDSICFLRCPNAKTGLIYLETNAPHELEFDEHETPDCYA